MNEASDSLIRVTLTVEDGKVTSAVFDDKLIPVANGGAAGIAELDDETKTALGDMVIEANDKNYARTFNCYYYVCDNERYIRNNLKFEDRKSTRYDTQWNPEVYVAQIKEITGLELSSTYKDPKKNN